MQHFQFYPDIHVKHLGGGTIYLGFSFYSDIRAKHLGGGNIFLGNVYNPMTGGVNPTHFRSIMAIPPKRILEGEL